MTNLLISVQCEENTCKNCEMRKNASGQTNCAIFQTRLTFDAKEYEFRRLQECKLAEKAASGFYTGNYFSR